MQYEDRGGLLVPVRPKLVVDGRFSIGGFFSGKILRDDEVIDEFEVHNLIVNQGLDHILNTEFMATPQITAWYMAPFVNNYVPVGTDTATSIVANAGETNAYGGTTRQPYTGVEGGQQITNAAAPANFTFTAALTIYGAFLISSSAMMATTGVLFAAAQFTTPKVVAAQDQLLLTYAFGAASS